MEPGAGAFSEKQFREACAELGRPALSGAAWELLVETQGISVYRLLDQQTGLYAYKVFGVLEDCLPDLLADVYMDLAYRKQWDQYVKELYEKECDGETVVYWQVKYPFPMSNRDPITDSIRSYFLAQFPQTARQFVYRWAVQVLRTENSVEEMNIRFGGKAPRYVYVRQRRELDFEGQKVHVILAQSTSRPQFPEKSGVIRVKQYKQSLVIQSDGKKGSKVFMYYFDNPGGQIPSWVINWAAKNGVPNFLKDMVKACQNYRRT